MMNQAIPTPMPVTNVGQIIKKDCQVTPLVSTNTPIGSNTAGFLGGVSSGGSSGTQTFNWSPGNISWNSIVSINYTVNINPDAVVANITSQQMSCSIRDDCVYACRSGVTTFYINGSQRMQAYDLRSLQQAYHQSRNSGSQIQPQNYDQQIIANGGFSVPQAATSPTGNATFSNFQTQGIKAGQVWKTGQSGLVTTYTTGGVTTTQANVFNFTQFKTLREFLPYCCQDNEEHFSLQTGQLTLSINSTRCCILTINSISAAGSYTTQVYSDAQINVTFLLNYYTSIPMSIQPITQIIQQPYQGTGNFNVTYGQDIPQNCLAQEIIIALVYVQSSANTGNLPAGPDDWDDTQQTPDGDIFSANLTMNGLQIIRNDQFTNQTPQQTSRGCFSLAQISVAGLSFNNTIACFRDRAFSGTPVHINGFVNSSVNGVQSAIYIACQMVYV